MITRDNYEVFFQLYVDKELSPADRQLVEIFTAENPDLNEDLFLLQECRFSPEMDHCFENKELLMSFARRHLSLHQETALLRQTVMKPDLSILFENKEILYKKEKNRTMPFLSLARIAAAAVVLGVIGLLVFNRMVNRKSHPLAGATAPVPPDSANADGINDLRAVTTPPPGTSYSTDHRMFRKNNFRQEKRAGNQPVPNGKDGDENSENRLSRNLVSTRPAPTRDSGNTGIVPVTENRLPVTDNRLPVTDNRLMNVPGNTQLVKADKPVYSSFATQALKDNGSASSEDEPAIDQVAPGKNKLRGIFRKVSRVFEKTTNAEDDRHAVLIGNFQVALK